MNCQFCARKYMSCSEYYQINVKDNKNRAQLICNGFIRIYDKLSLIPKDIYNICLKFFHIQPTKSIINPYLVCSTTGQGVTEMFENTIRTRLDIDHYHPTPPFLQIKSIEDEPTGLFCQSQTLCLIILLIVTVLLNNFNIFQNMIDM